MTLCFACDRKLGANPHSADTRDDQWVAVGSECYKQIEAAGAAGWVHPTKGGMRLWTIPETALLNGGPRIIHGGENVSHNH